jgi:hypothetical protein
MDVHNLRQRYGEHGTVFDLIQSSTVGGEQSVNLPRSNPSPRKSTRMLALEQEVPGRSVQRILHEARFQNYIRALAHVLLKLDTDRRLHFVRSC